MTLDNSKPLEQIIETILFVANKPMTEHQILALFDDFEKPSLADLRQALFNLKESYYDRAVELAHIASGYQFQTKIEYAPYILKMFEEKPSKYSRALLETLALIAYKQPVTRGEIEEIRGVAVSSSIFKTLDERSWIRVVGHKEVPGRPGLYATTKTFLDYFKLKSLDELPSLPEILNFGKEDNATVEEDAAIETLDEVMMDVMTKITNTDDSELASDKEDTIEEDIIDENIIDEDNVDEDYAEEINDANDEIEIISESETDKETLI